MKKKPAPFGYYFCELDGMFYIKEFDWTPQEGYYGECWCYGECWWKSTEDGDFLPYSISFDERYRDGLLEYLGPL